MESDVPPSHIIRHDYDDIGWWLGQSGQGENDNEGAEQTEEHGGEDAEGSEMLRPSGRYL